MYTAVSDKFKEMVKSNAVTATARITLAVDNTVLDGNNLMSVVIKDYCSDNGTIIGTTMCKEAEIEIINDGYDLADKEFLLEVGVEIAEDTIEYIPYGNFTVKEYTDMKSNNKYKIVAYDYMDKLNQDFTDNNTYPMTLQAFYAALATQYGVEIETQTLPNQDFVIQEKPYFDGTTGRTVLSAIAQMFGSFAKFNRNNKLQMYLKNETEEEISREQMNSSLEIDNIYGPITTVVLSLSNVTGENVTRQDDESIATYGETILEIQDNPFTYTEELRSRAIEGIYNRVLGFSYIPTTFNYKAYLYSDCGDIVKAQNMNTDDYVNTIILNQDIKIPATRQSKCTNAALTKTAVTNKYTSPTNQAQRQTEIAVDKANSKINALVKTVETISADAITSVKVQYALSDSETVAPTTGWNETAPIWQDGKYMWQRTVVEYADGRTTISAETNISGAKGEDGRGISDTVIEYQKSTSGTDIPTGTWTTTIPTVSASEYLWTRTTISYTTGFDSVSYSVSMIGATGDKGDKGDTGDTGIGVKAIEAQYYLSTSNTTQTGGNWKSTQDEWQSGKYYWTRSKITWTDDTVTYTEPELAEALNNANSTANNALNNTTITNTTEEAKEFHLTDSADSNCKSAEIFGESKQDTREGYNLIKYNDSFRTASSAAGITSSITTEGYLQYVLESGNSNWSAVWWNANNVANDVENAFEEGDTFTVVFTVKKTSGSTGVPAIYLKPGMGYYLMIGNITTEFSEIYYTGTWKKTNSISYHLGFASCVGTFIFKNWMIKKGEYQPYEPYGAMPSPDYPSEIESVTSPVTIKSTGKNLIPFPYYTGSTTANGVSFVVNEDGTIIANGTATADGFFYLIRNGIGTIPLKKGNYTYSGVINGSSATYYLQPYKNGASQSINATTPVTITAEDGDKITGLAIFFKSGAVFNNVIVKPQLEFGTEATDYEAYKESITAIPLLHDLRSLPNGTRDRIYYSDGKWYDEQNVGRVVLDGSETFSNRYVNTGSTRFAYTQLSDRKTEKSEDNLLSNYFKCELTVYNDSSTTVGICGNLNNNTIYIRMLGDMSYDDFKTWLSEHNTEVLYELAEPIITEITDEETIKALESIKTYKGITNITSDTNCILTYYRDVPMVDEYETKIDANKKQTVVNTKFAKIEETQNDISLTVSNTKELLDAQGNSIETLTSDVTSIKQTSAEVLTSIETINNTLTNGVSAVLTRTVKISQEGLRVGLSSSDTTTLMNETGVYIENSSEIIATYDKTGAIINRLRSNYAIIGGIKHTKETINNVVHHRTYVIE